MSRLCRATLEFRNVRGARPSRSLGGASRAALPDKDVFGGTPNTARETHALPTYFSAFQKCRIKRGRKVSDYSLDTLCRIRLSQTGSKWACRAEAVSAKADQTMINIVKHGLFGQDEGQIPFKCFKANDLQRKQLAVESRSVKPRQTTFLWCYSWELRIFGKIFRTVRTANDKFSMTNLQFRLSALDAACRAVAWGLCAFAFLQQTSATASRRAATIRRAWAGVVQ
jgi:hypothetical protein